MAQVHPFLKQNRSQPEHERQEALCARLPLYGLFSLYGLPPEDWTIVSLWCEDAMAFAQCGEAHPQKNRYRLSTVQLEDYLRLLVELRQNAPVTADLVSELAQVASSQAEEAHVDLVAWLGHLLLTGWESMRHRLRSLLFWLAQDPERWHQVGQPTQSLSDAGDEAWNQALQASAVSAGSSLSRDESMGKAGTHIKGATEVSATARSLSSQRLMASVHVHLVPLLARILVRYQIRPIPLRVSLERTSDEDRQRGPLAEGHEPVAPEDDRPSEPFTCPFALQRSQETEPCL